MNVKLSSIQMDTTIQCRAKIDTSTVNEYSEAMENGDTFPPVVLFGDETKCWVGDGWHRIMAAEWADLEEIPADLRPGNRAEALKHALSANAAHGRRRTNEDKRRAVEIALAEWPTLSSRMIAEMCGVSDHTVEACRPATAQNAQLKRVGLDGKERPATRTPRIVEDDATNDIDDDEYSGDEADRPLAIPLPPSRGMQLARIAIMKLKEIREDDVERQEAFDRVETWIKEHRDGVIPPVKTAKGKGMRMRGEA